jgi:hypothetical protein
MKICFKKDKYHTHSRRATSRSQPLISKMGCKVHSCCARLCNSQHDETCAAGSGDPSISPMYGKPGESTTACAWSSDASLLYTNSSRIACFVSHETKSHLEQQDHVGQSAQTIKCQHLRKIRHVYPRQLCRKRAASIFFDEFRCLAVIHQLHQRLCHCMKVDRRSVSEQRVAIRPPTLYTG